MELVFEGKLPANQRFQRGERLILFQIHIFSKVGERKLSLERKPSVLEAGASSILLPCDN
jgi:hypothetical protein